MNTNESQKHRKNFAIGLAIIGGFIALASFSSTYSINLESFQDWPGNAAKILALFASVGIEVMFVLVIYAIGYALVGFWEKALGVASLGSLLFVMTTNFVIHRQIVKGIPLSGWQQGYYDWAGAGALFGILLFIVLFGVVSHEAKERRQQRELETIARQRAIEWQKEVVRSDAFIEYLEPHKKQVFEKVKKQLALPEAKPEQGKGSGYPLPASETQFHDPNKPQTINGIDRGKH